MMVSTRGRYALRVLIDLAVNGTERSVPMREVAKRQGISLKYLERIMPVMVQAKFVQGASGRNGGYKLAVAAETIRVGDVLRLTEGSLAPVSCIPKGGCCRATSCATLPMWRRFQSMANTFFNSITVADLAANAESYRQSNDEDIILCLPPELKSL